MIKLKNFSAIVFVLFGSQAFANVITDTEVVDKRVGYLFEGELSRASWTHDLSDQAFIPGTAVSATLSIEISDDYDRWWNVVPEFATIVVGILDFQDDDIIYRAANDWGASLGINSLVSLNVSGLLDVTVQSIIGDFLVGNSILEVTTAPLKVAAAPLMFTTASISDSDDTSIPEPAALLLMCIGLAGLGATRIKKAKRV